MLLSLVTGLGHVYLRHYMKGALLFALFATALNGVFLGSAIESDKTLAARISTVSVPAAIAVWVVGLVHAYKISYGTDRARLRAERAKLLRDGLVAYLRDDLDGAAHALRAVVDRDVDWEESDALFHLAVVELRRASRFAERNEPALAQRARSRGLGLLKLCLTRDDRRKWRAEIAVERERARFDRSPRTAASVSSKEA
jgi:hypothetical protein